MLLVTVRGSVLLLLMACLLSTSLAQALNNPDPRQSEAQRISVSASKPGLEKKGEWLPGSSASA